MKRRDEQVKRREIRIHSHGSGAVHDEGDFVGFIARMDCVHETVGPDIFHMVFRCLREQRHDRKLGLDSEIRKKRLKKMNN